MVRTHHPIPFVWLTVATALAYAHFSPAAATTFSQSIVFVPYDKLAGPKLDVSGSVLVPYAEFLRIKAATDGKSGIAPFTPHAALSQANYRGDIKNGVAALEAELTLETLADPEHYLTLDLPFSGAA